MVDITIGVMMVYKPTYNWGAQESDLPSGELTKSYGKWPLIVDFPIKNGGSFHGKMLVHQRVMNGDIQNGNVLGLDMGYG